MLPIIVAGFLPAATVIARKTKTLAKR